MAKTKTDRMKRILIIEDHPDWRRQLTSLLRSYRYQVVGAKTRSGALGHLAAATPKIDVILLDMMIDGTLDASEEICQAGYELGIPVVAISGPATRAQVARFFGDLKIRAFVEKVPFDEAKLVFEVKRALQGHSVRVNPRQAGRDQEGVDVKELIMGNKYVAKNVLSQGDHAHIHDVRWNQGWSQTANGLDLDALADELASLRLELKKQSTGSSHDMAVGAIASAEEMARKHEGPKTLERLAGAGSWCLEVAKKVGLEVASKAIEAGLKAGGLLPG